MSNQNNTRGTFGKGYYIALILCAFAIGITGYVYYRNSNRSQPTMQDMSTVETSGVKATKPAQTEPAAAAESKPTQPPVQEPTKAPAMKVCAPVSGNTVSEYAMECLAYNQTTRDWRTHSGVDIAAQAGTEVVAACDGTVYTTYNDDLMGTTVVIRHNGGYTTTYASLAEDLAVAPGQNVTMGQTIGCVGSTALLENALEDHVHFSVTYRDAPMDPEEFLGLGA